MKVEKDIPIPSPKGNNIFRQMEVGDSFIAERTIANYYATAARGNVKITSRKQKDGTTRVWLVAKEGPQ